MDFEIYPETNKIGKKFQEAIKLLSRKEKKDLFELLRKDPYKGNKRGQFYSYELSQTDRLLYKINKKGRYVLIVLVGGHPEYERYLNKYKR